MSLFDSGIRPAMYESKRVSTCVLCGDTFKHWRSASRKYCSRSCSDADHHNRKHGWTGAPEYRAWKSMKYRCYNSNYSQFKDYGGRGIEVCDEWVNDFEKFLYDMGRKPTPNHSLDRIDNNKDYSSDNCQWATYVEQANNRRPYPSNRKSVKI